MTNYSFFSAILETKLFSTTRWHIFDGTDYPQNNSKYFASYKNLLKNSVINKKDIIKWCRENKTKVRKYLRENGFKFYTTDDDYITKCYGYYIKNWHDGTITVDFEPLDQLTEGDLGHVHMLYKDKKANTGYQPL